MTTMGLEELDRMPKRVRDKYLEILRAIPPGRKIEITVDFCDATRELVLGVIRSQHPDATEDEIRREFSRHVLPEDIRKRVYGS